MIEFKDLPVEIQEKMLDEQVRQGNTWDVEVFEKSMLADANRGGFAWGNSEEGFDFWDEVLLNDNLAIFYEKYPKEPNITDEAELIIRRFVNHAKIHGFPSKSFKKKVKRYLASVRDNASKKMYTEEEVRNLFIKRCKDLSTKHEKFSELLLEQDLKWFEENKK